MLKIYNGFKGLIQTEICEGAVFMEKILNKMERKIGRYAIHDLMKYICVLYCAGLVISFVNPQFY